MSDVVIRGRKPLGEIADHIVDCSSSDNAATNFAVHRHVVADAEWNDARVRHDQWVVKKIVYRYPVLVFILPYRLELAIAYLDRFVTVSPHVISRSL